MFLETSKGVPTNWAGTPDEHYLELPNPFAKPLFAAIPDENERQIEVQWLPPLVNSEDGSTLTPGPMVEEIATRLM